MRGSGRRRTAPGGKENASGSILLRSLSLFAFPDLPLHVIQLGLLGLPLRDAEWALPLEANQVAFFECVHIAVRFRLGSRGRGLLIAFIFQACHSERRLTIDPLL